MGMMASNGQVSCMKLKDNDMTRNGIYPATRLCLVVIAALSSCRLSSQLRF